MRWIIWIFPVADRRDNSNATKVYSKPFSKPLCFAVSSDVLFPSNKMIMKSIARVSVFSTNIYQAKMDRKFLRNLLVTKSWFCGEMNILHHKSHFTQSICWCDCPECLTKRKTLSGRFSFKCISNENINLFPSPWFVMDEYILVDKTELRLRHIVWAELVQAGVRAHGGQVGAAAAWG